ncbi:MAG: hypothetical protein NTZ83_02270 [Candidatus Pacearchaeota archaeon]|nr:hypothetical protein [Candidatus Pacearchaeota archaeon]
MKDTWICIDCKETFEKSAACYMITKDAFKAIGYGDQMICFDCFKKRLKKGIKIKNIIEVIQVK